MKLNLNPGPFLLFFLFLGLKLAHVTDWSWWWVSAPLWISAIFTAIGFFIAVMVVRKARKVARAHQASFERHVQSAFEGLGKL